MLKVKRALGRSKQVRHSQARRPSIRVIGCGEAFSSELGNTSYLLQGPGVPKILFDCGYQIPERLWRLDAHTTIEAICFTHLHADHVFGIVPLLGRYWEEKRTAPLQIISGRGSQSYIKKLVDMGYPGLFSKLSFPIEFIEISEQTEIQLQSVRIRAAKAAHSIENYAIRVDFSDSSLRSFAVSGDGQVTPETCALVADVGVLFQEIYSAEKEIPVHANLTDFSRWAKATSIKQIAVAHHARAEISEIHKRVLKLKLKDKRWTVLKPGMTIPLRGKNGSLCLCEY